MDASMQSRLIDFSRSQKEPYKNHQGYEMTLNQGAMPGQFVCDLIRQGEIYKQIPLFCPNSLGDIDPRSRFAFTFDRIHKIVTLGNYGLKGGGHPTASVAHLTESAGLLANSYSPSRPPRNEFPTVPAAALDSLTLLSNEAIESRVIGNLPSSARYAVSVAERWGYGIRSSVSPTVTPLTRIMGLKGVRRTQLEAARDAANTLNEILGQLTASSNQLETYIHENQQEQALTEQISRVKWILQIINGKLGCIIENLISLYGVNGEAHDTAELGLESAKGNAVTLATDRQPPQPVVQQPAQAGVQQPPQPDDQQPPQPDGQQQSHEVPFHENRLRLVSEARQWATELFTEYLGLVERFREIGQVLRTHPEELRTLYNRLEKGRVSAQKCQTEQTRLEDQLNEVLQALTVATDFPKHVVITLTPVAKINGCLRACFESSERFPDIDQNHLKQEMIRCLSAQGTRPDSELKAAYDQRITLTFRVYKNVLSVEHMDLDMDRSTLANHGNWLGRCRCLSCKAFTVVLGVVGVVAATAFMAFEVLEHVDSWFHIKPT